MLKNTSAHSAVTEAQMNNQDYKEDLIWQGLEEQEAHSKKKEQKEGKHTKGLDARRIKSKFMKF